MKKLFVFIVSILVFTACNQASNDTARGSNSSVDGQGGSLATFILKGNYLYTVDFKNLSVFNISNTTKPVKVNTVNVGFDIETLFSYGNFLFIGSRDAMFIYDISNAELPKKMSQSNHFRSCDPVVANGTNAYVTLHSNSSCRGTVNELRTYDVTDVENPKLLNTRGLKQPKGLSLFGDNYLLVCDGSVKIFDVSDPKNSKFLKEIPTKNAIDIIIRNNHAFIISETTIEQFKLNYNEIKKVEKISTFTF